VAGDNSGCIDRAGEASGGDVDDDWAWTMPTAMKPVMVAQKNDASPA
jgi:hypothetical protein